MKEVQEGKEVKEVRQFKVNTEVEHVLTGRYSSQLQLRSGLGMLVS